MARARSSRDRPATWADATRVTSEHAYIEFVDVSPDGQQLAVSSDRRGNQDLWVLPAAGGEMTPLTTDPTPDWSPRWSPDGSQIAFYAYRSGNRDIWVMPSGGGPARQLTFHPGFDWFPSWSPDGREIAFGTQAPNSVAIVSAAGGEPSLLTSGSGPAWSPDGQWLVFLQDGQLFRIARDGRRAFPHSNAPPTDSTSLLAGWTIHLFLCERGTKRASWHLESVVTRRHDHPTDAARRASGDSRIPLLV